MKFFTSACFGITWVLSITTSKYFCFLRLEICGKHQPTTGKASGVNWAESNWNDTGVLARLNISNDFSPFDHWSGNEAIERKPKMLTYVFIIFSLLFLKSWEQAPQILPRLKANNYLFQQWDDWTVLLIRITRFIPSKIIRKTIRWKLKEKINPSFKSH